MQFLRISRSIVYLLRVRAVILEVDSDVLAEGPATETAQMIWANIHGWVSLELMGIGFVDDLDAIYDRVCLAMLRGLAP